MGSAQRECREKEATPAGRQGLHEHKLSIREMESVFRTVETPVHGVSS
jgi:hypothetical protein